MNSGKNLVIALLLIVIGLLSYMVFVQNNQESTRQELARLKAELRDSRRGEERGDSADDYEKNEVKNTILKGAADKIQICFKAWMKDQKDFLAGRIAVDWRILPDGSIEKPEIVSSEIPAINVCVLESVRELKFPPPPSGEPRYITHKFFFKRETE